MNMVIPIRLGNAPLAEQYEAVLTEARGVHLIDISRDQLRSAARLRATIRIENSGRVAPCRRHERRVPVFCHERSSAAGSARSDGDPAGVLSLGEFGDAAGSGVIMAENAVTPMTAARR